VYSKKLRNSSFGVTFEREKRKKALQGQEHIIYHNSTIYGCLIVCLSRLVEVFLRENCAS
jgi:hypothetical protein